MGKFNVHILLDTSGSMDGEPIIRAKQLITDFICALKNNSETSVKTDASLIAYNMSVTELIHKLSIENFPSPEIPQITSGPKNLGLALQRLNRTENNIDLIILITKGNPSDIMLFNQESQNLKKIAKNTIVLHGNIAKATTYSLITNRVISWDNVKMSQLVSQIFGGSEIATNDGRELLQAPPKTIEITI